ncbi:restriction endonuclease subunit S [Listeria monocytogenes]|nr:restriction endonuclease subunit S [Listeria monocytogenes]EAF4362859.1 restriction endonuclease subunit S [Listeria monocytogenes]
MSHINKKIPKRRFEEFNNADAWEQRKLNDMVKLENGYAIKSTYFSDVPSKTIVLTPGNVRIGGGFKNGKGRYYNEISELPHKFIFQPEDIFVTLTDLTPSAQMLGYPAVVPNDGIKYLHNQRLGKLTDFKGDKFFLFQLLSTDKYHKNIVATAIGTTVKHSSIQKILQYETSFPSLEEQKNIGTFFKKLDKTIALHQRKLEKIKALKAAYLSEMFPAKGETKPKRRFVGFTNAWEQSKLGELADIIGGGTPSTSNFKFWDGDIDWYSPAEIGNQNYLFGSKKKITQEGLEKSSARIHPIGTVLFTSRAGIGNTAILGRPGATNQGFQSILPKKNILDSYFIFSRTPELKKYGEASGAGSTFVEVSGKQMARMPILMPTFYEQQKIGSFFKQLDKTITIHQRKLQKLQNIKKAYLNEMFI